MCAKFCWTWPSGSEEDECENFTNRRTVQHINRRSTDDKLWGKHIGAFTSGKLETNQNKTNKFTKKTHVLSYFLNPRDLSKLSFFLKTFYKRNIWYLGILLCFLLNLLASLLPEIFLPQHPRMLCFLQITFFLFHVCRILWFSSLF